MQPVVCELYQYVDGVQLEQGRPCVWMPWLSEITVGGRHNLTQALMRFVLRIDSAQSTNCLCIMSFELYYFEGQLELPTLLKDDLDDYYDSDYSIFPTVHAMKKSRCSQ